MKENISNVLNLRKKNLIWTFTKYKKTIIRIEIIKESVNAQKKITLNNCGIRCHAFGDCGINRVQQKGKRARTGRTSIGQCHRHSGRTNRPSCTTNSF